MVDEKLMFLDGIQHLNPPLLQLLRLCAGSTKRMTDVK